MQIYKTRAGSNPNISINAIKNAVFTSLVRRKITASDQEIIQSINTHLGFLSFISNWNYEAKILNRVQNIFFIAVSISPKELYFDESFPLVSLLGITENTNKPYKIIRLRVPHRVSKGK